MRISDWSSDVCSSDLADYELRWFTPGVEVALCGHATLASGHVLLSAAPWRSDMRFRTRKAGILRVARAGEGEATGHRMALPAYPTAPKAMPDIAAAVRCVTVETLGNAGGNVVMVLTLK